METTKLSTIITKTRRHYWAELSYQLLKSYEGKEESMLKQETKLRKENGELRENTQSGVGSRKTLRNNTELLENSREVPYSEVEPLVGMLNVLGYAIINSAHYIGGNLKAGKTKS